MADSGEMSNLDTQTGQVSLMLMADAQAAMLFMPLSVSPGALPRASDEEGECRSFS